jgi:hypothetical protein
MRSACAFDRDVLWHGISVTEELAIEEIPIDSGLIFPFADSILVCGREQLLL